MIHIHILTARSCTSRPNRRGGDLRRWWWRRTWSADCCSPESAEVAAKASLSITAGAGEEKRRLDVEDGADTDGRRGRPGARVRAAPQPGIPRGADGPPDAGAERRVEGARALAALSSPSRTFFSSMSQPTTCQSRPFYGSRGSSAAAPRGSRAWSSWLATTGTSSTPPPLTRCTSRAPPGNLPCTACATPLGREEGGAAKGSAEARAAAEREENQARGVRRTRV